MAERTRSVDITARDKNLAKTRPDIVAVEEPLEIRINDDPLAVVMRTPGDDLELTAGFLFAEEIIRESDDLLTLKHCTEPPDLGNVVKTKLAGETTAARLAQKKAERTTVTSASCGVCGKRSIESLHVAAPPFEHAPDLPADLIRTLPDKLRQSQAVFDATGGLHAAAIFDAHGELLVVKEDVGRHNAVDKCVGHLLLREQLPLPNGFLMVSGRTSFEIVQKALVARIPVVCAISAPSSLAIDLARASGMGLVAFLRGDRFNIYAPTPVAPADQM